MAKTESKKNNTKNKSPKKNTVSKKPINTSLSLEITCILIICFSILLIISIFFGGGGFLGNALNSFFKGLFGIGAYLLPIIMIVSSVYLFFSQVNKINIFKVTLSIISFTLLISFFHIITRQDINNFSSYFTYLGNEYKTARFLDGGVLGALIGDLFLKIIIIALSYSRLFCLSIAFFKFSQTFLYFCIIFPLHKENIYLHFEIPDKKSAFF